MKLNWDDYYPSLGNKTIVVRGVNKNASGQSVPLTGKVKAEVAYPSSGMDLYSSVNVNGVKTLEKNFVDGKAEFTLSAQNIAPPINGDVSTGLNKIDILFTVFDDADNEIGRMTTKWNIKNNSNTNLQEVLDGKAVFVYDNSSEANHQGVTSGGSNSQREMNYIQELLNQVVPRKRKQKDGTTPMAYNLITENGVFNGETETALETFKEHFSKRGDVHKKISNSKSIVWRSDA